MAIFKFRNLKTGQATPISSGEFTIGRDDDADVQVDDPSVSRHHARLINEEHGFFLEDLGSANGVALQGQYVTGRMPVKFGDIIHIGKVPFRIDPEVPVDPPAPPEPDIAPTLPASIPDEPKALEPPAPPEPAAPPKEPQPIITAAAKEETPLSAAITFSPSPDQPPPSIEPAKSGPLIRHSVPLPKLIKLTESPSAAATPLSSDPTPAASIAASVLDDQASPAPIIQYGEEVQWWWWLIMFLAGLGSGLLLGLYFAKAFLDFGGKPGALP